MSFLWLKQHKYTKFSCLHGSNAPCVILDKHTAQKRGTYSCQVSQAHREANGQGCRAGDITSPFISDCNDTQHQLEGRQELYAYALAWSDTVELRELWRGKQNNKFVSQRVSHHGHFQFSSIVTAEIWQEAPKCHNDLFIHC